MGRAGRTPGEGDHALDRRYPDLDDDALFRDCVERRAGAMAELVRRFSALVRHIIARSFDDPEEREDVYQEVFLAVCHPRTLESVREGSRLRYFVAAIVRNKCRDRIRARRDRPGADHADFAATGEGDPEEGWDLQRALDRLPATKTVRLGLEIIRLRYWEDRTYREISRRLDIPVGSIGPTLARLFAAIRRMMREEERGAGADVSERRRRQTGRMKGG